MFGFFPIQISFVAFTKKCILMNPGSARKLPGFQDDALRRDSRVAMNLCQLDSQTFENSPLIGLITVTFFVDLYMH